MKKDTSNVGPCTICKMNPADKTNSHLIPSFFIAMVSSVDNSYKRDKELLYTIGQEITTVYIVRSVKEEELLHSFDSITDERLSIMGKNTGVKDYIFCSHCEKKLGEYLESPWHNHLFNNKSIAPDIAYDFWVSSLWRISYFDGINFKLSTYIETALRKRLNAFIHARDSKCSTSQLMCNLPFTYKVLYCKDYSKHRGGLIYYEYDHKSKIATLLLGDVAACFSFNRHNSFERLSFYGLESHFSEAPVNDGSCQEFIYNIKGDDFDVTNSNIIHSIQSFRLKTDRNRISHLWYMVKNILHMPLPPRPIEPFVQFVISLLYDSKHSINYR